ncbi:MAG: hypothetical protein LBQ27_02360 [Clostridiales bacterium]|jgi:cyclic beta-1,2-glucan synthetase|nr:hypothetical protein [Clostridiales bacterium]
MLWIGLTIFCFGAGLAAAFILTRTRFVDRSRGTPITLDEKAYMEKIKAFALEVKNKSGDDFVRLDKVGNGEIHRAYALVDEKIKKGERLYEFEKWIYDNYYILDLSKNFSRIKKLPSIDGKPVVVGLADVIIESSIDCLNFERIKRGIYAYTNINSLTVDEVLLLKAGFDYAVFKRLRILARRAILLDRAKRAAKKPRINGKYIKSNSYLYYMFEKYAGKNRYIEERLEKNGADFQSVNYIFAAGIAETNAHVAALISYLLEKETFSSDSLLSFSKLNNVLIDDSIYKDSDTATKTAYLKKISALAKKSGLSEIKFFERLYKQASECGTYFGELIFYYQRNVLKTVKNKKSVCKSDGGEIWQKLYALGILITALIFTVAAVYFIGGMAYVLSPFFFVIFLKTAFGIFNYALNMASKNRVIFGMDLPKIADENRTMIVISQFIASKEQFYEAVKKAETLQAANDEENTEYALLIDFPPSDREHDIRDEEILEEIDGYKGKLSFFVRKRTKVFDKYGGRERKRGAVMALSKLVVKKNREDFRVVKRYADEEKEIKFFILLDDDNELLPDSIKSLVNRIIHPLNNRYDMLALRATYNAFSLATTYSKRYAIESGIECYPYYSGLYHKLFNREVFTGKCIVRAESLYSKLYGLLPENRILSHDIIEGAALCCSSSGIMTFEDAPKGFSDDLNRINRWQKGDILLLMFLKNKTRNAKGEKIRLKISALYKTIIFVNAVNILYDFCLIVLLFLSYFYERSSVFYISAGLSVFFNTLFFGIAQIFQRKKRTAYKIFETLSVFKRDAAVFLMSPFFAFNGIAVYVSALIHLIFKPQRILEWKPFYIARKERQKNNLIYLIPSLVVVTAISVYMYAAENSLLFGILAPIYAAAFMLYTYNGEIKKPNKQSRRQKKDAEFLTHTAKLTYGFFDANLKNNALICDNFQKTPYLGASENTSPTNIGFSILAVIANYYFKLAEKKSKNGSKDYGDLLAADEIYEEDIKECLDNIDKILFEVEKLEKWRGHLYNWYNITTKETLTPRFVSSVDSANFVAAIITVKEFCQVIGEKTEGKIREQCEDLYKRAKALAQNADFSALYDFKQNLFYIGYDAGAGRFAAHYDLLASEAGLLSYIGTINSLPCWFRLGRKTAKPYFNTLYSWSGTMFEYLMANIFLKPPERSLLYKSAKNASRVQMRTKCNGVFGLSESGYYLFDDSMKYQYRAFGVNILSLKSKSNECVISPYGSFLALKYLRHSAIKNLLKQKELGMVGEYGYFEAKDFNENKTVSSYMAHHQGMIMCSAANYLFDDIFCRLFMRDKRIASGRQLLSEKQITSKPSKSIKKNEFKSGGMKPGKSYYYEKPRDFPAYNILSNGRYTLIADESGRGYSVFEGMFLTKKPENIADAEGKYLYITDEDSGEIYSPTYAPLFSDYENCSSEFFKDRCVYTNSKHKCSHTVNVPAGFNGEIHVFKVDNTEGERTKNLKLCFFGGSVILGDMKAYLRHKTFYNMFVNVENKENCFFVKRKGRSKDEKNRYSAMLVKGLDVIPEFNRYNFLGRNRTLRNPLIIEKSEIQSCCTYYNDKSKDKEIFPSVGDVIEPCFGFTARIALKKGEKKEFSVVITAAEDAERLEALVKRANTVIFDRLLKESPDFICKDIYKALSHFESDILTDVLPHIIDTPVKNEILALIKKSAFYDVYVSFSDAFESKILYFKYSSEKDVEYLTSVLKVFDRIRKAGISVKLLIYRPNVDIYHDLVGRTVRQNVKDFSRSVIVLDEGKAEEAFFGLIAFINFNKYREGGFLGIAKSKGHRRVFESKDIACKANSRRGEALESGAGYFLNDGSYMVDKATDLPYANVVALKKGGFVVTDNGGGFTFFDNSGESKISVMYNDPVSDTPSERVFVFDGGRLLRVNKGGTYTLHRNGMTEFYTDYGDYGITVREYPAFDGEVKIFEVYAENNSNKSYDMTIFLDIDAALGAIENKNTLLYEYKEDSVTVKNIRSNISAVLKTYGGAVIKNKRDILDRAGYMFTRGGAADGEEELAFAARYDFFLRPGKPRKFFFALSKSLDDLECREPEDFEEERIRTLEYFTDYEKIKIKTGDVYLDMMFNHRLPYQVVSSRINGRCGFYQAGGAIGFRDQLQDVTALVYTDPKYVRSHILLCAEHQYAEGDVMHWWHPPKFGVRTHISDDKLFLPYCALFYVGATGDLSVLFEEVPYMVSPPLLGYEHNRLERPDVSDKKETLLKHLERAIESALKYGEHDLLLMGTGDWNDALDNAGSKGRGESVWLSMFMYKVLEMYKNVTKLEDRLKYSDDGLRLKKAINAHGFDGDRFRRAFTDDGEWLGSERSKYCKIDLLCQSFAVLSEIAPHAKTEKALDTAKSLVDFESGIVKLFAPPFDGEEFYGYISAYPYGVRENGGQYTHAVMWYISALFKSGRADEAYAILKMINPAEIMSGKNAKKYNGEPYVIGADVSLSGKMGWNWYTGSAGLMYRVILEDLMGITMKNNSLVIKPNLPSHMQACSIEYRYKKAVYNISIKRYRGKPENKKLFMINGVDISNGNCAALKEEGTFEIEVYV